MQYAYIVNAQSGIQFIPAVKKVTRTDHKGRLKLVAKHGVDERIDGAVSEARQVCQQHREEEVLLQQKAVLLHLRDEANQVER